MWVPCLDNVLNFVIVGRVLGLLELDKDDVVVIVSGGSDVINAMMTSPVGVVPLGGVVDEILVTGIQLQFTGHVLPLHSHCVVSCDAENKGQHQLLPPTYCTVAIVSPKNKQTNPKSKFVIRQHITALKKLMNDPAAQTLAMHPRCSEFQQKITKFAGAFTGAMNHPPPQDTLRMGTPLCHIFSR